MAPAQFVLKQINHGAGAADLNVSRIQADRLVGVSERIIELTEVPARARAQLQKPGLSGRNGEAAGGIGDDLCPSTLSGEHRARLRAKINLERIEADGFGEIIDGTHRVFQAYAYLARAFHRAASCGWACNADVNAASPLRQGRWLGQRRGILCRSRRVRIRDAAKATGAAKARGKAPRRGGSKHVQNTRSMTFA